MHELYGSEVRKREEEMQDASETKTENTLYVKPSKTKVVCPKCKGKRIKPATMTGFAVYGSPDQRYVCEDCGYCGSLILDVSEQEKSELDIAMEEDLMKIKKELGL